RYAWTTRRGASVSRRRLCAPIGTHSTNGVEEYPTMTNGTDADFLQVLLCQVGKDPLVDFVVAECRLVFFEAQAPQPDHDVHNQRPQSGWRISCSLRTSVSSTRGLIASLRTAHL